MKKHPDYNRDRPYNDRIIKIHKEHGIDNFTADAQFWTLGGPQHHEYHRLAKHLNFGPNSYHTVDKGQMAPTNKPEIVAYPNTQFSNIYKLWNNPIGISYDSTELLTSGISKRKNDTTHDTKIIDLARLTLAAIKTTKHQKIAIHANYMVSYPATKSNREIFFENDYVRWVSLYRLWLEDYTIKTYDGVSEKMEGSRTEMVDFHFVISK